MSDFLKIFNLNNPNTLTYTEVMALASLLPFTSKYVVLEYDNIHYDQITSCRLLSTV